MSQWGDVVPFINTVSKLGGKKGATQLLIAHREFPNPGIRHDGFFFFKLHFVTENLCECVGGCEGYSSGKSSFRTCRTCTVSPPCEFVGESPGGWRGQSFSRKMDKWTTSPSCGGPLASFATLARSKRRICSLGWRRRTCACLETVYLREARWEDLCLEGSGHLQVDLSAPGSMSQEPLICWILPVPFPPSTCPSKLSPSCQTCPMRSEWIGFLNPGFAAAAWVHKNSPSHQWSRRLPQQPSTTAGSLVGLGPREVGGLLPFHSDLLLHRQCFWLAPPAPQSGHLPAPPTWWLSLCHHVFSCDSRSRQILTVRLSVREGFCVWSKGPSCLWACDHKMMSGLNQLLVLQQTNKKCFWRALKKLITYEAPCTFETLTAFSRSLSGKNESTDLWNISHTFCLSKRSCVLLME